MDTSRNKFSNITCIAFSAVLALLFCYAVGIRFEISNTVSRAIIAAVYCTVVVGLAFALNRIVKMMMSRDFAINDDKVYLVTLIADSILFVVFRLLVISDIIKVEFSTSNVYEMAKIGEDGKCFVSFSSIDAIFATMLSGLFKLFGNTFFPVYFIQFIFSLVAFILIVYSVNRVIGRFASGFTGAGLAVLPVFFKAIARDSADCFILFLFSFVLFLTAKYKQSIEDDRIKILFSLIIGVITGILSLFSAMFLYLVIIPIIVLWDCRSEYTKDRAVNTFIIVVGNLFGFALTLLIDSYLVAGTGVIGFAETLISAIGYRFGLGLNTSMLKMIVSEPSVYLLMVSSIVYCVMFWKNEDDTAHIPVIYWMLLLSQVVFIRMNNQSAGIIIFALLLLIISAVGVYDLGYTESLTRLYRLADDMEPAVITSIEGTATNIEINRPIENSDIPIIQSTDELLAKVEGPDLSPLTFAENTETKLEDSEEKQETDSLIADKQASGGGYFDYLSAPVEETVSSMETDSEVTETTEPANNPEESNKSKYDKPEERKETDYGINNADFESLFSNTNIPPKSVYKDYLSVEEENSEVISEDAEDGTIEVADEVKTEEKELYEDTNTLSEDISETDEETETDIINEGDEVHNDSKDKKAYVDSFFGYLYGGEETHEEPAPVKEEYVSHADKFADLDLDLGFDAFDNISQAIDEENTETDDSNNSLDADASVEVTKQDKADDNIEPDSFDSVSEELISEASMLNFDGNNSIIKEDSFIVEEKNSYDEVVQPVVSDWYNEVPDKTGSTEDSFEFTENEVKKPTNYEEEFVFDFSDLPKKDGTNWEPLKHDDKADSGVEDEVFRALSDLKTDETVVDDIVSEKIDFSDKASENIDLEKIETEEMFFDSEDDEDEVSIEEMLEKKIDESFSYEDALNVKLDNEEIDEKIGFSYEEALEKKLAVEESINNAIAKENFSFEEALNDKLIAEDSLEEARENDFESIEHAVAGKMDIQDMIESNSEESEFSFQEAIETKLDVEQILENADNDKMLEEFGDDKLFENIDMSFSGIDLTQNAADVVEELHTTEAEAVSKLAAFDVLSDDSSEIYSDTNTVTNVVADDATDIVTDVVADDATDIVTVSVADKAVSDVIPDVADDVVPDAAPETEEEPVQFIENPLPLPKKHVPREMDYGRVIPAAWMHYDVEVDKSNNFYDI